MRTGLGIGFECGASCVGADCKWFLPLESVNGCAFVNIAQDFVHSDLEVSWNT